MKRALALTLCLLLCGCQQGPAPEEVGEALCKLYVHGDSTGAAIPEGWDAAGIAAALKEQLYSQLEENLSALEDGAIEEEQLQAVTAAILEARKRIPITVELLDSDREQATLQVNMGSVDSTTVDEQAAEAALEAISGLDAESGDYVERFVEEYLSALEEGFSSLEAEEGEPFTMTLVKTEGQWLPQDLPALLEQLGSRLR